ncbi:MAG: proteinral secretion pathway protein G [Puniceicoccaceae bacterium 5H]|nr:MAG: proteinral secretion pathway protein G [Puniceicoccaceae bacterium 5H]
MKLHRRSFRHTPRGGFTITEMLIVFALISVLTGLVVGGLGGALGGGQKKGAKTFVKTAIEAPLTSYRIDVGSYPTTEEGLQALWAAPAGKESRWDGPYIDDQEVLTDPWGEPYQYRFPGTKNPHGAKKYDIWSKGEDQTNETEDDIGNW